jgi:hypothetical protein
VGRVSWAAACLSPHRRRGEWVGRRLGCDLLECKGEQGQGKEGARTDFEHGAERRKGKRNFQNTFFVKKNILEIAR